MEKLSSNIVNAFKSGHNYMKICRNAKSFSALKSPERSSNIGSIYRKVVKGSYCLKTEVIKITIDNPILE